MFKHMTAPALLALFLFSIPSSAVTYPALPTATVDVTCCPAVTRTVAVHTATQLQAAFDNATLGDEIVLDAGTTYKGNFILRVPSGTTGWVTVRSTGLGSLPSPGTRVATGDASKMAKIMSPNYGDPGDPSGPALQNDATTNASHGAHHYRFIGIEFATGLSSYNYHVIQIVPPINGTPYTSTGQPHDIILDRCLIHGNDPFTTFAMGDMTPGTLNGGVVIDAINQAEVDSKIFNFWGRGNETQSLSCRGGPGPWLVQNNEISGGAESFICGGALLPYSDVILTDVTITHNFFDKPLAWKADGKIMIKNLFELKVGKRVRITDNVFDGVWVSSDQYGAAITLTARPAQASSYNHASNILLTDEVSDILIAHNVAREVGTFVSTSYIDSECVAMSFTCVASARQMISDNLAVIDTQYSDTGFRGAVAYNMADWSIKRNTFLSYNTGGNTFFNTSFLAARPAGSSAGCPPSTPFANDFEFSYNIADFAAQSDCAYDVAIALGSAWGGTVSVTGNLGVDLVNPVLSNWTGYNRGALTPATSKTAIGLNSDFLTLSSTSTYFGTGVGANLSCFNEAAVRAGTPSALCPLPPEVQQTGSQAQAGISCDLNKDGVVNVLDVQLATNQVLGYATCGSADLIGSGQCNIVDVQRVISTSLGASCHLGP